MTERFLPPRVIQVVGLLAFIGACVFWAVSGKESVLLVSSALSLIGLGAYADLKHSLENEIGAGSRGGESNGQ